MSHGRTAVSNKVTTKSVAEQLLNLTTVAVGKFHGDFRDGDVSDFGEILLRLDKIIARHKS